MGLSWSSALRGMCHRFFRLESKAAGALCTIQFLRNRGAPSGGKAACVSLHSLEVSEAYTSLTGPLVLDVNLVCSVSLANVIVSWQLPLYSVSDKCIKSDPLQETWYSSVLLCSLQPDLVKIHFSEALSGNLGPISKSGAYRRALLRELLEAAEAELEQVPHGLQALFTLAPNLREQTSV